MPRSRSIFIGLSLLLVCALALALLLGSVPVPPRDWLHSNILQLRLARILLALAAGAGLSVAGVIFQALLRNPLAEPYLLGISSGSALGAAGAILFGLAAMTTWSIPVLAFAAGLATLALVYALARNAGGLVPIYSLLLTGVTVNAVFGNLLMFLASSSTAENLHSVVWWLLGSLQIFDWTLLRIAMAVIGLGVLAALMFARLLNVMTLGEESAAVLGVRVEQAKLFFFAIASLITGATVAACGMIGFVGLLVPHFMRLLIGPDHRRLLPACALAGGTFLILADLLSRTLMAPMEIPIGVITTLAGGPLLLFLLRHKVRSRRI